MTPPEHLKRALTDMLTAWLSAMHADPVSTDHYRERSAVLVEDAIAALNGGATPYEVMVLIVAPAFLGDDEVPAEIVVLDDEVA